MAVAVEQAGDAERVDKQQEDQHLIRQAEPSRQQHPPSRYQLLDRLLLAAAILLLTTAAAGHLYIKYRISTQEQALRALQVDREKWATVYTSSYLKQYQQRVLKDKAAAPALAEYRSSHQQQIEEGIGRMKQQKCGAYQRVDQYDQMAEMVNPYQQQAESADSNIQAQTNSQSANALSPLSEQQKQIERTQQKQQQQVAQINSKQKQQQAEYIKNLWMRPIAGITEQKISNAKQYKSLTAVPPWEDNQLAAKQYQYYDATYRIGDYTEELPFCVVVPTFNNEEKARYKLNIDSIVQQNYTNYHVVVIDDASTDRTGPLLDEHVAQVKEEWAKRGKHIRIEVYHNSVQNRAMPNIRKAALEYCKPHQIFVIVDGDDQLIGRQVLKLFNSQFQAKNCWFAYSNFMSFVGAVGFSRPFKTQVVEQNRYRQANFVTSHLRAFYTQLFRLIKQQDLKDQNGQYLRAANDVAICIPILEMAHTRVTYIPEITYLYNSNTGLNNHLVRLKQQIDNSKLIRKRNKYFALSQLKFEEFTLH